MSDRENLVRNPVLDLLARMIGDRIWGSPREKLAVEFEQGEPTDLAAGRIVSNLHEIYRMGMTGDFAFARDRQIELTIRGGEIARYEMRIVG